MLSCVDFDCGCGPGERGGGRAKEVFRRVIYFRKSFSGWEKFGRKGLCRVGRLSVTVELNVFGPAHLLENLT